MDTYRVLIIAVCVIGVGALIAISISLTNIAVQLAIIAQNMPG